MMNPSPLGEISLETFLENYWQKKPLLIRNAFPDIEPPIAADILAGLSCEEDVESRLIVHAPDQDQWDLKHGPFNDDIFLQLPEAHWTLLVQAVDHWVPEVSELLNQFDFIPRWRIDDLMISYASKGGGVGPHLDNYDVFLLQTSGQRQWQIDQYHDEDVTLRTDVPLNMLEQFEAAETWTLNPGDMLYVPPRFGHHGVAVSDDCMTCSIGFRAPSHADILREYTDFLGENLNEAVRYSDPELHAQNNTGEISEQALEKVKNILEQYINDDAAIKDWFGRYITTPKYQHGEVIMSDELEDAFTIDVLRTHLESGGFLARNESSRFAYQVSENKNTLFVDGQCIETDESMNELIQLLCNKTEWKNKQINQNNENLELLLKLIQRGAIYLVEL